MGEYADLEIDRMLGGNDYEWGFSRRKYSRPKMPTCRYCNESHLYWKHDENHKWLLAEYNTNTHEYERHVCKMKFK